jgi:hypothetical protein
MESGSSPFILIAVAEPSPHSRDSYLIRVADPHHFYADLDFLCGPNGTRFARCHFKAQKCLDF